MSPEFALAEISLMVVCQSVTVVLTTLLLLFTCDRISAGKRLARLVHIKSASSAFQSSTIRLYLATNLFGAASCLPIFVLVLFYPMGFDDDILHVAYSLGSFYINYYAISSIPVFFLTLDRCLVLKYVRSFRSRLTHTLAMIGFATIVVVYAISETFTLFELPLRPDESSLKRTAICCEVLRFRFLPQATAKSTFVGLNLVLSIYFFHHVRRRGNANTKHSSANFIIGSSIVLELLLSVLPNIFGIGINITTGETATKVLGPTTAMALAIEAMLSSAIYVVTLVRRTRLEATIASTTGGTSTDVRRMLQPASSISQKTSVTMSRHRNLPYPPLRHKPSTFNSISSGMQAPPGEEQGQYGCMPPWEVQRNEETSWRKLSYIVPVAH